MEDSMQSIHTNLPCSACNAFAASSSFLNLTYTLPTCTSAQGHTHNSMMINCRYGAQGQV